MRYIIDIDEEMFIKPGCFPAYMFKKAVLTATPLQTELEKIRAEICKKHKIDCDLKCRECIYYPCLNSDASYIADIKILDKHIKELTNDTD